MDQVQKRGPWTPGPSFARIRTSCNGKYNLAHPITEKREGAELSKAMEQTQGRNEVNFFIADPVILPKFLIPGSKRNDNFDPLSRKILVVQKAWSLIQWRTPLIVIPDPTLFWPLIPDPIYLVTTLKTVEQHLFRHSQERLHWLF